MSLLDIAAQLNPGGAEAVRADAAAEWSVAPPAPAAPAEEDEESEYEDAGPAAAPASSNGEGALPAKPADPAPEPGPPVPPPDIWETAGPEDSTKAIPSVHPPIVPRTSQPGITAGDPLAEPATAGESQTAPDEVTALGGRRGLPRRAAPRVAIIAAPVGEAAPDDVAAPGSGA